ncbi:hypothetical protein SG34_010645 [Thalassomonas viridans]|uniref:Uncharacterized protein n=1 Tax=Thalassomonas viridans TaxID=137584 RepID=A0AAF0CCE5_9GAMM|nr:hypothetical protein [Thalassomonas viridans]WDE07304.1 hypothetical protein SG34_010645 [Thalassomonas viridans]
MVIETLFLGSSNKIVLLLKYARDIYNDNNERIAIAGDTIPFVTNGVTKMELYINGITVSSTTGRIIWNDHGHIELDLGGVEGIEAKKQHQVSLKIWDAGHPTKGQVVIHPRARKASVRIDTVASEL